MSIAFTMQTAAHTPHPLQTSNMNAIFFPLGSIAGSGQYFQQIMHPVHFASLSTGFCVRQLAAVEFFLDDIQAIGPVIFRPCNVVIPPSLY
jgi:hypothetical protein